MAPIASKSISDEPIQPAEMKRAEILLVRYEQRMIKVQDFVRYSPFYDETGMLRVGGRLNDAVHLTFIYLLSSQPPLFPTYMHTHTQYIDIHVYIHTNI